MKNALLTSDLKARVLAVFAAICSLQVHAADEFIRSSGRVVTGVVIRASASISSERPGLFVPGEQALFLASAPCR